MAHGLLRYGAVALRPGLKRRTGSNDLVPASSYGGANGFRKPPPRAGARGGW